MIDDTEAQTREYFDYLCGQLDILEDTRKQAIVREFAKLVEQGPRKYKSLEDAIGRVYDELFDYVCENYDESLYNISVRVDLGDGTTICRDWKTRNARLRELDT